jgi:hypothetical protein
MTRFAHKDLLAGAIFVVLGLWFTITAALRLDIGTAFHMGPGFFPVVLGSAMTILGISIAIVGYRSGPMPFTTPVPWRAVGLLTLSPILFGLTIHNFGIVIATFLCVITGSFASREISIMRALVLTIILTVFCVGLFVYGLGQPIMLFPRGW